MKITLEVPESRAAFLLELLHNLPFVRLMGQAAPTAEVDETAHLLSSPANAARLYAALERDIQKAQQRQSVVPHQRGGRRKQVGSINAGQQFA